MEFINCYRIANSRHIDDLSGEGAYLFGGRWNSEGIRMLYCSSSISLSILEVLVYVSKSTFLNKEVLTLKIPEDSIQLIEVESLHKGWDSLPSNNYTKRLGDDWIKSMDSLALKVPSVINAKEYNILLNPLHPRFKEVEIVSKEIFSFDRRLVNKKG